MQQQKILMNRRFLSTEEVAKELRVKKYLIGFWGKTFNVPPVQSYDGTRGYSNDNVKIFAAIRDLVHNQKMSVSQAKRQIAEKKASFLGASQQAECSYVPAGEPSFKQNLQIFKEQLLNLKQLLDLE